jgi:23S rRNA pseudouridine1911/1915/1917 synthase
MLLNELILYEDNHILVVNKPANLSSLPNEGMHDIVTEMKEFLKMRDGKKGNVFLHPVHRLDKAVSGILVMAKTSKALSRLNEQIRQKCWKKIYIAKLSKNLPEKAGKLVHHLCKKEFFAQVYVSKKPFSKEAILYYRHLRDHFYEIELETGRYHQIRAQLAFMKCPIDGDEKYGGSKDPSGNIQLHHAKLTFYHPVTKNEIVIDSKPAFY